MLSRFSTVIQNAVDAVSLVIRIIYNLAVICSSYFPIYTLTRVLLYGEKHSSFRNFLGKYGVFLIIR
jgi:hypothetical protein